MLDVKEQQVPIDATKNEMVALINLINVALKNGAFDVQSAGVAVHWASKIETAANLFNQRLESNSDGD
jgi:hypothetical protein